MARNSINFYNEIKTHGHNDNVIQVSATGGNKLLINLDKGANVFDCAVPNAANVQIEFDYDGAHNPLEDRSVGMTGTIILQNPMINNLLSFHSTTPIVGSIMTPGGTDIQFNTEAARIAVITFTIFSRDVDNNPYALINYVGGFLS